MASPTSPPPAPDHRSTIASGAALGRWLATQRWYSAPASGTRERDAQPFDAGDPDLLGRNDPTVDPPRTVALGTEPPVAIGLVETPGGDRYQLLLGPGADANPAAGDLSPDQGSDPSSLAALARFVAGGGEASAVGVGTIVGHWLGDAEALGDGPSRLLGAEQSNTSAVVGGHHVLKVLRRLQPGLHPELEIGRHLAATAPEPTLPVARLAGWYHLVPDGDDPSGGGGDPGATTTLGVVQVLVPGALDGWALVLSALAGDPAGLLVRLRDLGTATAVLHGALARPAPGRRTSKDAREAPQAFGAVPLTPPRTDAVVSAVTADAEQLLATTLDRPPALAAVVGRAAEVVSVATALVRCAGEDLGASIRHHGDLHLGQTVVGPDGWVFLDFEGEPTRSLDERRQRHSPLRDVAAMMRSFSYAAANRRRSGGTRLSDGWERAARAAYLDGYLAAVDPALLPASAAATARLLALFELEKVVYEIRYELSHRPDWLSIPVEGLTRLLDTGAP
ncbi:MAG: hypothetical protein ACR2LA_05165 [Acidimicrobiales bacterium]